MTESKAPAPRSNRWLRIALAIAVVGVGLYLTWQRQDDVALDPQVHAPQTVPDEQRPPPPTRSTETTPPGESSADMQTRVAGATILDLDGEVAFEGTVDLAATLDRIQAGKRLSFPNDGSTFQNRERRLSRQAAGYYKEYVHPTPGLSGPGPQRLVVGQRGETYYTPDHYRTFQRLDQPADDERATAVKSQE